MFTPSSLHCFWACVCVKVVVVGGAVSLLPASIQTRTTIQHWFHSLHAPPSLSVPSAGLTHQRLRFPELYTHNRAPRPYEGAQCSNADHAEMTAPQQGQEALGKGNLHGGNLQSVSTNLGKIGAWKKTNIDSEL